jgi:tryptophan synthase beta chain
MNLLEEEKYIHVLDQKEIPDSWYNIQADIKNPLKPPLHPATKQPITLEDMMPLFPVSLIEQEMSREKWINIPGEVLDIYRIWRPTPLIRARRLEKYLNTPAKIYYKYEGVSPTGSHKPNSAIAQAYYNKKEGVKKITTETGAGQWGSSLAYACSLFEFRMRNLYGESFLPSKALQKNYDANVWCKGNSFAIEPNRSRSKDFK